MAKPIYADHPFPLISSPEHRNRTTGRETDVYDHVASEMAIVHNMMVRGMNAIYLQAPHIRREDVKDFVGFIDGWATLLHVHHTVEEEDFFPWLEATCGEKGMMQTNVEQHHAFHDGFEEFRAYVAALGAGTAEYDGRKIVGMLDGFGPAVREHLGDEIPTLSALRKHEEHLDGKALQKLFDEEGQKNMAKLGLKGLALCLSLLDLHFEDDLWKNFPPIPWPINFVTRSIVWWLVRNLTRFGACDRQGNMRPLKYAGPY